MNRTNFTEAIFLGATYRQFLLFLSIFVLPITGHCEINQQAIDDNHPYLETRLPNSIGYTWEEKGKSYLDAKISIQYPIFFDGGIIQPISEFIGIGKINGGCNKLRTLPYFSYTGEFGQYLRNTYSSPVITKTFNPELFIRFFSPFSSSPNELNDICNSEHNLAYFNQLHSRDKKYEGYKPLYYFDVQYGHLSDGQGIDNQQSLNALSQTKVVGGDIEFAKKYISRGWDYYGIEGKKLGLFVKNDEIDILWHHYIGGILQGSVEEYPWETPTSNIQRLQQVSGLRTKYAIETDIHYLNSVAITLETGTEAPFHFVTSRIDVGLFKEVLCIPLIIWFQRGYIHDLAQYYKFVASGGFAFQFTTFNDNGCKK